MDNIQKDHYHRYVLFLFLIAVTVAVFFIIQPFIGAILSSLVLAYVFYPVYKFLKKYLKNQFISSLLVVIVVLTLFTLPLVFLVNSLSNQAIQIYIFTKQKIDEGIIPEDCSNNTGVICGVTGIIGKYAPDLDIKEQIKTITKNISVFVANHTSDFLFGLPKFLLSFFIMLFILFFLLKEGDMVAFRIRKLLPFKEAHQSMIFNQLSEVTFAVIYGHILVAAIQGVLGIIAFWIFGVPTPILWGFIMFFFALIPFMGTPVVWVPAVLFKVFEGSTGGAIGLLIAGLFISTIDNFIKPKIVADKADVHPVIVLLGVIGGLGVFGIVGIIIGPVILSVFVKFIDIYEEEKIEIKD